MVDLHSILAGHHPRKQVKKQNDKENSFVKEPPTFCKIPDLFFDEILINNKIGRVDGLVLMYLYRYIWCRPNLYRKYGIGPVHSHAEFAKNLRITLDELYQSIQKLESLKLVETIRSGQYFVRKYFTESNDQKFGQTYDDF